MSTVEEERKRPCAYLVACPRTDTSRGCLVTVRQYGDGGVGEDLRCMRDYASMQAMYPTDYYCVY
jgi:hypothetical protein